MKATERLRLEHGHIDKALGVLDILAMKVEGGSLTDGRQMLQAIDFFRDFADFQHHKKEETILFPALAQRGFPMEMGPIRVMLQEHAAGRGLLRDTESALRRFLGGEAEAGPQAARIALSFSSHLRQHIFKENNMLFPMADQVLTETDQAEIQAAFSLADQGEGEGTSNGDWAVAVRRLALSSASVV